MSTVTPVPLGSIERAYADGYNAAQHEIDRLRAENEMLRADKDVIRSQERNASYEKDIDQLEAEIKGLRAALEPFARNADAVSLSEALGHIEREHLLSACAALEETK